MHCQCCDLSGAYHDVRRWSVTCKFVIITGDMIPSPSLHVSRRELINRNNDAFSSGQLSDNQMDREQDIRHEIIRHYLTLLTDLLIKGNFLMISHFKIRRRVFLFRVSKSGLCLAGK